MIRHGSGKIDSYTQSSGKVFNVKTAKIKEPILDKDGNPIIELELENVETIVEKQK